MTCHAGARRGQGRCTQQGPAPSRGEKAHSRCRRRCDGESRTAEAAAHTREGGAGSRRSGDRRLPEPSPRGTGEGTVAAEAPSRGAFSGLRISSAVTACACGRHARETHVTERTHVGAKHGDSPVPPPTPDSPWTFHGRSRKPLYTPQSPESTRLHWLVSVPALKRWLWAFQRPEA